MLIKKENAVDEKVKFRFHFYANISRRESAMSENFQIP